MGIDHAATQDLHPSRVLAEAATLAATDVAGDIHLGAGLREGEVAGTKANLRVGAKHLAGKGEQHLLQVGEAHALVHIQALHLVEEAVGTGRDGLVAIDAPGQRIRMGGSWVSI